MSLYISLQVLVIRWILMSIHSKREIYNDERCCCLPVCFLFLLLHSMILMTVLIHFLLSASSIFRDFFLSYICSFSHQTKAIIQQSFSFKIIRFTFPFSSNLLIWESTSCYQMCSKTIFMNCFSWDRIQLICSLFFFFHLAWNRTCISRRRTWTRL